MRLEAPARRAGWDATWAGPDLRYVSRIPQPGLPITFDLAVVGGSPAGLSLAVQARRAGLSEVIVLGLPGVLTMGTHTDLFHPHIRPVDAIQRISAVGDDAVEILTPDERLATAVCVIDFDMSPVTVVPDMEIPRSVRHRVHTTIDFDAEDTDVLVIGGGEPSVTATTALVDEGARVVFAFTGDLDTLSLIARQLIEDLEREQRVTVLWQPHAYAIWEADGFPMVTFRDRRTPDLQFDHVVIGGGNPTPPAFDVEVGGAAASRLYSLNRSPEQSGPGTSVLPHLAWQEIRAHWFPGTPQLARRKVTNLDEAETRRLAASYYNATITSLDTAHNELWRIRVRPDRESVAHLAGQYCSLGLGYWEPRADDSKDRGLDAKRHKLIRRSYSISSPIFDERGYLFDQTHTKEIELYIVWVQAEGERVPALTPRLALKHVGDRLYVGPRIAGRYGLVAVIDPGAPILFCATGTGEAPHNAMIVELLRKGHHGPILSSVSVRYRSDLAYLEEHRRLADRFANYSYLPMPTREDDVPKRYLQDLFEEGTLEHELGARLEPETSHVFLCGNPTMIGLPEWDGGEPTFPNEEGMAELLHKRGFTLDRRGTGGNVHYEEYW